MSLGWLALASTVLSGFLIVHAVANSAPVEVRYQEGSVHGYLALRALDGTLRASGDMYQTIRGGQLTSRLVYRFKDGSIDDESAVFTQNGHFRLVRDHHLQKGPSFPVETDLRFDVTTGQVIVRYVEHGQIRQETSHMNLPEDLANGILLVLVKNPPAQETEMTVSYLAATPKPRVVRLSIKEDGTDTFTSAGLMNIAQRYRIHVDLGGLMGVIAPLIGKEPADAFAWVSGKHVPAFIKSENPLYLGGPLLRTELISPVWKQSTHMSR
jgi:hypothetical protein